MIGATSWSSNDKFWTKKELVIQLWGSIPSKSKHVLNDQWPQISLTSHSPVNGSCDVIIRPFQKIAERVCLKKYLKKSIWNAYNFSQWPYGVSSKTWYKFIRYIYMFLCRNYKKLVWFTQLIVISLNLIF